MQKLKIRDEFIRLGQALKLAGLVDTGAEAKLAVQGGQVSVNGEVECQRGRKLRGGDIFEFEGSQVQVVAAEG